MSIVATQVWGIILVVFSDNDVEVISPMATYAFSPHPSNSEHKNKAWSSMLPHFFASTARVEDQQLSARDPKRLGSFWYGMSDTNLAAKRGPFRVRGGVRG